MSDVTLICVCVGVYLLVGLGVAFIATDKDDSVKVFGACFWLWPFVIMMGVIYLIVFGPGYLIKKTVRKRKG